MGASSSFMIDAGFDIYLSYPKKTEYMEKMMETLYRMNFQVIDSSMMIQSRPDISPEDFPTYMELFINKTKFIFICISKETVNSVNQTKEIHEIMVKYPILKNKIIYFMMDSDYTPITNMELKNKVKQNVWYPIYDEESLFYTSGKLLTFLMNNQ